MSNWFQHLPTSEEEKARKTLFLRSVLRTLVLLAALGFIASLFDSRNNVYVGVAFYAPIFLGIYGLHFALRRGRVLLAAWSVSVFFWVIIAIVTLFFGGLQGQNAGTFVVCTMLIGSVVGGRAAIGLAAISCAWCAFIAILEREHALPPQLGPSYSPINAWSALTVSIILTTVLMRKALESLREMHAKAVASAAERDEALRRSIQAQKMELVGNLAGGVAHDFNNLLSVISSVSEGLRSAHDPARVEEAEMLDELDDATSRAVLITRQLLSFGRSQHDVMADVDLDEQVRAMAPMLERLMGPNITVEVQSDPAAVVRATRVGLEQVLLNLAVNARESMPEGGSLRVEVHVEPETVRLLVKDTGIGMDAATKERIFAPFYTTKASGTGLGLATVREKVEQFGGAITVDTAPGRGSTFEIRLTRAAGVSLPEPPPPSPVVVSSSASTMARLLVVDDDATVRRAFARLLEQAGFEVVAVTNGAEAIALLERPHEFACVISDLAMPVLDGAGLAARLTELEPTLPLVLMSGNRVPEEHLLGPRRLFLEKPVARATLLRAIEQVRGPQAP